MPERGGVGADGEAAARTGFRHGDLTGGHRSVDVGARTTSPAAAFPGRSQNTPAPARSRNPYLRDPAAWLRTSGSPADRRVVGSQAKLYLTDPVLAWLPARLRAGLPDPDMTRLTESVLAVTLARAIDGLEEGRWTSGDTIAYARTLSGNEVDLAPVRVPTPAGVVHSVPLEAK